MTKKDIGLANYYRCSASVIRIIRSYWSLFTCLDKNNRSDTAKAVTKKNIAWSEPNSFEETIFKVHEKEVFVSRIAVKK